VKLIPQVARFAAAGVLVGGIVAIAAPANATTVSRGDTDLLTCNDVVNLNQIKDSTGAGITFTTLKNLKVSGVQHPEKGLPGSSFFYPKYETDADYVASGGSSGTADVGDTDTCTGTLSTPAASRWAGFFVPNTPIQQTPYSAGGTLDEITKIAGALNGRATLNSDFDGDTVGDACTSDASTPANSGWTLHGKLVIEYGNDGAGHTPSNPAATALDGLGKKVGSQVYLNVAQDNAPDNTNLPADADDCPDTQDLLSLQGIVIKGVGNGAWFDSRVAFSPPANNGTFALEAISNTDLNLDTIVGEPPAGGLKTLVADTDTDSNSVTGGALDPDLVAQYNNSTIISIDLCSEGEGAGPC
jgi:hypothetical protein